MSQEVIDASFDRCLFQVAQGRISQSLVAVSYDLCDCDNGCGIKQVLRSQLVCCKDRVLVLTALQMGVAGGYNALGGEYGGRVSGGG